jgi:hypothetical protein
LEEHRGDEGVDRVPAVFEHLQRSLGDDGELGAHHHRVADGLLFRSLVVERIPRVGRVLAGCETGGQQTEARRKEDW